MIYGFYLSLAITYMVQIDNLWQDHSNTISALCLSEVVKIWTLKLVEGTLLLVRNFWKTSVGDQFSSVLES